MSTCTDPEIGQMIYAYELGILSKDDVRRFEEHLFDCDYCASEVEQFGDAVHLLKWDREVRKAAESKLEQQSRKRLTPIFRLSLVAAAVLVFLIIQPWQIRIDFSDEAVAFPNLLAIMYFEDLSGGETSRPWGRIVTDLLIADLSESSLLSVLSGQRLYDELKLIGHEQERVVDREIATSVASRSGSRWMLTGSVIQVEPAIVLSAHIIDVKSGVVLSSERVVGMDGETVFSIVDRLSRKVHEGLVSDGTFQEQDRSVADISTSSVEAYEYYLAGVEHSYHYQPARAAASLRKAIEHDSTFALAHFALSKTAYGHRQKLEALDKAIQYIDKVNDRQRRFILAGKAYFDGRLSEAEAQYDSLLLLYPEEKEALLGKARILSARTEYRGAIDLAQRALALDSSYRSAWRALTRAADRTENFTLALKAAMRYVDLVPDEAASYNQLGMVYAHNGLPYEAIKMFRKGAEIDSLFIGNFSYLAETYLIVGDYPRADSVIQHYMNFPNPYTRSFGRHRSTLIARRQGKFRMALQQLDEAIEMDLAELEDGGNVFQKLFDKASILAFFLEDFDSAISVELYSEELAMQLDPDSPNSRKPSGNLAVIYAASGDWRRADSLEDRIRSFYDSTEYENHYEDLGWRGALENVRGNFQEAIRLLERCRQSYPASTVLQLLGRAYLGAGHIEEAVATFETALNRFDRAKAINAEWGVLLHYDAAKAYEEAGMRESAITQYETFLDIWKDADEGLRSVEDARYRLESLKNAF